MKTRAVLLSLASAAVGAVLGASLWGGGQGVLATWSRSAPPPAVAPAEAGRTPATPIDLASRERKVFSQFGEDGVIEAIFEVIEPTHRYAVEFGASDGVHGSNVRNLVLNHGWGGLQIEGNAGRARKLIENYRDYPSVKTLHAWVWPGNIELLFEENGVPPDFDFLVIDIDSNDYYVWRAIHDFRPKVVMIEVNTAFPPPQKMVIEFHPMNFWDGTLYAGASLQSLYELGKKKGYELIYQTKAGGNVFFVDEQYFPRFGIKENSPEALYHPVPAEVQEVLGVPGPDGVLIPKGKEFLVWENLRIRKRFRFDR
jgi:hypothetical protein